jgi:glutamine cyclotransferase/soluble cytochrome b562
MDLFKTLTEHTGSVLALCSQSQHLCSGSADKTIKIWDTTTWKCLETLTEHAGVVWSLCSHNQQLCSGSADKTIKIWDTTTWKCLETLTEHTDVVWSLCSHNQQLCSGSGDKTIKIWDTTTLKCLETLTEHTGRVTALCSHNQHLCSGSADNTIKIWDTTSFTCIKTLTEPTNQIVALCSHYQHLCSSIGGNTIKIWDTITWTCLETLTEHNDVVWSLCSHNQHLCSGSFDQTIKIWDTTTWACLKTLTEHTNQIVALCSHNQHLCSGSVDAKIKSWEAELKIKEAEEGKRVQKKVEDEVSKTCSSLGTTVKAAEAKSQLKGMEKTLSEMKAEVERKLTEETQQKALDEATRVSRQAALWMEECESLAAFQPGLTELVKELDATLKETTQLQLAGPLDFDTNKVEEAVKEDTAEAIVTQKDSRLYQPLSALLEEKPLSAIQLFHKELVSQVQQNPDFFKSLDGDGLCSELEEMISRFGESAPLGPENEQIRVFLNTYVSEMLYKLREDADGAGMIIDDSAATETSICRHLQELSERLSAGTADAVRKQHENQSNRIEQSVSLLSHFEQKFQLVHERPSVAAWLVETQEKFKDDLQQYQLKKQHEQEEQTKHWDSVRDRQNLLEEYAVSCNNRLVKVQEDIQMAGTGRAARLKDDYELIKAALARIQVEVQGCWHDRANLLEAQAQAKIARETLAANQTEFTKWENLHRQLAERSAKGNQLFERFASWLEKPYAGMIQKSQATIDSLRGKLSEDALKHQLLSVAAIDDSKGQAQAWRAAYYRTRESIRKLKENLQDCIAFGGTSEQEMRISSDLQLYEDQMLRQMETRKKLRKQMAEIRRRCINFNGKVAQSFQLTDGPEAFSLAVKTPSASDLGKWLQSFYFSSSSVAAAPPGPFKASAELDSDFDSADEGSSQSDEAHDFPAHSMDYTVKFKRIVDETTSISSWSIVGAGCQNDSGDENDSKSRFSVTFSCPSEVLSASTSK